MRGSATDQSILTNVLNVAKTASIAEGSPNYYMSRAVGIPVTKTITCNGNGAQLDNLFTVTGSVFVTELYGVCTESTNATTLETTYFDLYDGAAAAEITDNAGTDLSGITVGSFFGRGGDSDAVLGLIPNSDGGVMNGTFGTTSIFKPCALVKKSGQTTYIRFCFTGDENTDVDVKFYVKYIPITDDGAVTAV